MGCELWTLGSGLRAVGGGLRTMGCELWVPGCVLWVGMTSGTVLFSMRLWMAWSSVVFLFAEE